MDITALLARLPLAGDTRGAAPAGDAGTGGATFTDTLMAAIAGGELPAVLAAADPAAEIPPPATANPAMAALALAATGSPAPAQEGTPADTSGEDSDGGDRTAEEEITQAIPLAAAPAADTRGAAAPKGDGGAQAPPPVPGAVAPERGLPRRDTAPQAVPATADADPAVPVPGAVRAAAPAGMGWEAAAAEGFAANGGTAADSPSAPPGAPVLAGVAGTGAVQAAPAQPSAPAAAASLQAPVASPAWGQELGHQLVGLARRGEHRVELHLNPRELGPLSVSLTVDDQGARAQFFSAHAPVRGAVEQAIPQLRDALAQQGIALGEASVGEQQQQSRQPAARDYGGGPAGDTETAPETPRLAPVAVSPTGISGGVDLYA